MYIFKIILTFLLIVLFYKLFRKYSIDNSKDKLFLTEVIIIAALFFTWTPLFEKTVRQYEKWEYAFSKLNAKEILKVDNENEVFIFYEGMADFGLVNYYSEDNYWYESENQSMILKKDDYNFIYLTSNYNSTVACVYGSDLKNIKIEDSIQSKFKNLNFKNMNNELDLYCSNIIKNINDSYYIKINEKEYDIFK